MGISIYNLHRSPAIFPSPHSFLPSRWLADPSPPQFPRSHHLSMQENHLKIIYSRSQKKAEIA
jgi:cytochrome P450